MRVVVSISVIECHDDAGRGREPTAINGRAKYVLIDETITAPFEKLHLLTEARGCDVLSLQIQRPVDGTVGSDAVVGKNEQPSAPVSREQCAMRDVDERPFHQECRTLRTLSTKPVPSQRNLLRQSLSNVSLTARLQLRSNTSNGDTNSLKL